MATVLLKNGDFFVRRIRLVFRMNVVYFGGLYFFILCFFDLVQNACFILEMRFIADDHDVLVVWMRFIRNLVQ